MIHSTGVIILRSVQGFMNAPGYLDILQTRVLPWLDQTGKKDQLIVVQDNARYHSTPDIFQFCNQNGINVLQWPPYSPDLNVIENFWALWKRCIRKRRPRNMEQLMHFMNDFRRHARIGALALPVALPMAFPVVFPVAHSKNKIFQEFIFDSPQNYLNYITFKITTFSARTF